ncbi:MAG: HTTM domain-containing protein [Crocinitomicaceae bacterium]
MDKIFTRPFQDMEKISFFRTILYAFLLFNALSLLPIVGDIYAYYGLVGTKGWNTDVPLLKQGTKMFINILSHPANSIYQWVYVIFVVGQIVFLILGLFNIWPRVSAVLIYLFTVNLHMKGYLAFTGGEVLINNVLFYLMFIHHPRDDSWFGDFQNILNNTFYYILLFQVCILYLFSGLFKLYDDAWISGHAIQYISRLSIFESPFTAVFQDNYLLSAIAGYSALAYQLLFPFVVWVKRVKIPFLIFGVIFHLGIAIGMGIFTFGMIMIVVYILFLDTDQIRGIKQRFRKRNRSTQIASP